MSKIRRLTYTQPVFDVPVEGGLGLCGQFIEPCGKLWLLWQPFTVVFYTSAHGSGRRYYILLLKFLSFFLFFLSPQDLRDGSTDKEPF